MATNYQQLARSDEPGVVEGDDRGRYENLNQSDKREGTDEKGPCKEVAVVSSYTDEPLALAS